MISLPFEMTRNTGQTIKTGKHETVTEGSPRVGRQRSTRLLLLRALLGEDLSDATRCLRTQIPFRV